MRWMVVGAGGALGTDLVARLGAPDAPGAPPTDSVTALTRADLDVTDPDAVRAAVRAWLAAPGEGRAVLVNAAAYTAVDLAETDPDAAAAAWAVNAEAPGVLAAACGDGGATMVHVSTDYVLGPLPGGERRPLEPDDPLAPAGVYARSKLAGEERVRAALPDAHHVVRTAWLYGATGPNFVRTMARLARERDTLTVVDDQHGSPTWTADLADGLIALARSSAPAGTRHAAGGGSTTWWGLARAVLEELGADPGRVRPCDTASFPRPAPRPAWSVLSDGSWRAAGLEPLPPWREALRTAVGHHPELLLG
ncbi:dTDP-4-dehydrorhamnose reductase [Actinomycetospora succinea]|uniref:dTDP-4-dehydrorhamnose reductase n=2 Tax=Actinomycetospora succinea TaxID=663603 RepID=A0A4V3DB29_9PSEU|nr:dTDP-4-dehydrorhamnose reductase [Actinomycetospora succinea]